MLTTKVLIIGAGPTGLMAACQLARFNIDFLIIDEKNSPTKESRAIAVTARSLEIYQQMGLTDEILKTGEFIKGFSLYIDGKERASFSIGELGKGISDFSFLFTFEQSKNEELLHSYLKKKNKDVLWQNAFVSLKQNNNSVTAKIFDESNNLEYEIEAEYLIGADGAKSPVRHSLEVTFSGGTYENKFFLVDAVLEQDLKYQQLLLAPSRKNFVGIFPMYGAKTYRIIGTLPKEFYSQEIISYEEVEFILKKTLKTEIHIKSVNWYSLYKLHHRRVDKFSVGRAFLAGDAAHIHSPAGGQGMNTGLQDAYNLAWKLAFVIKKFSAEKLLDTYNTERLPFAKWLMSFTDRVFAFATSNNLFIHLIRKNLLPQIIRYAFKKESRRKFIFKRVSQIWYSYDESIISLNSTKQELTFKAGDRLPYILIDNESLFKKLTEPSFYLLLIGGDYSNEFINSLQNKFKDFLKVFSFPVTEQWKNYGVKDKLAIIVRPDVYIGLIADEVSEESIENYFREHFGFHKN